MKSFFKLLKFSCRNQSKQQFCCCNYVLSFWTLKPQSFDVWFYKMSAQGSKLRYLVLGSSEDPSFCTFWQIRCQRSLEGVTYLPEPLGISRQTWLNHKLMVIFFEGLVYHELIWSYSGNYPRKSWTYIFWTIPSQSLQLLLQYWSFDFYHKYDISFLSKINQTTKNEMNFSFSIIVLSTSKVTATSETLWH